MAKTKVANDVGQDDGLTAVKNGGVVKSSQTSKSKSKAIARSAAGKVEKAAKKVVKKGSDSEDDTSESSESSGSDSESEVDEVEGKKTKVNGKANGKANGAPKKADSGSDSSGSESGSDSDEEDDEDDSDSGDEAAPAVGGKEARGALALHGNDDTDESDASDSDGSEDKKSAPVKTNGASKGAKDDSDEGSDDSDSDDDDGDDDEDSSSDKDEKVKPEPATNKRKPDTETSPFAAKKSKLEAEDTPKNQTLFVGNLPWSIDENGLGELFSEFGEITAVRLITDRESGRSKGFGYVEFSNAEDAATALEAKRGSEVDGRPLNLDYSTRRDNNNGGGSNNRGFKDRAQAYGDQLGDPTAVLWVGNLAFGAEEQEVSDAFAEHANVKSLRMPTDPNSGAHRGFAYVEFYSVEDSQAAMNAMQGASISGRSVRLDYSQPRAPGASRGRGGGDRGGFGGRGGFGDRGGRGGGRGFGDRGGRGGRGGGRGGRGGSTNRGGMGDFQGKKMTF